MSGFSRLAIATVLFAGLGSVASAQALRNVDSAPSDHYDGLVDGRSVVLETPVNNSGAFPPSESQTVMGLRVPR